MIDPAERRTLGRTSVDVTRLGLGTAPLGGLFEAVSDDEALATIECAWERGIRFFDTAPLYGYGNSERRLGRVLAGRPRGGFVLSTKVGRLLRTEAAPDESSLSGGLGRWKGVPPVSPVFDFSYDGVLRSLEESLERLGLDRVDVLHIHDPDEHHDEALSGAFRALDGLRAEGVIAAVGAGMNQPEMLVRFAREADFDCFLVAGRYTLLDQAALSELLPLCHERGIGVVLGGVFNSGVLADPRPGATFDYAPAPPAVLGRAQLLRDVCTRHAVSLKAAALQFAAAHPAVTCVLLGARSVEELDENVALAGTPVPAELWDELRRERLLPDEAPVP